MWLAGILSLDEDIIQVDYDKDIELLGEDLIDISLKASWSLRQTKGHHLVLKVAVSSLKSGLLFVTIANSHPVVDNGEIQLSETLNPAQTIQ